MAKHASANFSPEDPSIGRLDRHNRNNVLCPVRAWKAYRARRAVILTIGDSLCFWPYSQCTLERLLKDLIRESRNFVGKTTEIQSSSHQFRKFAASYSKKFLALSSDHCDVLRRRMGCASMRILNKVYIDEVPSLSLACAVPLGTVLPDV